MATPNYVLVEDYSYVIGPQDTRVLKAGSFVRPVEFCYLPTHITKELSSQRAVKFEDKVFCYTFYGMLPIPKKLLRQR